MRQIHPSAALIAALLATGCAEQARTTSTSAPVVQAVPATAPSSQSTATPAASTPSPAATAHAALTLVSDRSLVCMVNNQFMGRPQIPIEVDGRTYFGCCEMCKGRLANDPTSRVAIDPVSQRSVDKATAVIGKTDDGTTLYFENEQTFAAYAGPGSP